VVREVALPRAAAAIQRPCPAGVGDAATGGTSTAGLRSKKFNGFSVTECHPRL
jgi:hypothetical protein